MTAPKKLTCIACTIIAFISMVDQSVALIGIDDAIEIIQLGKAITSSVLEVWDLVEQRNVGQGLDLPFRNQKQKKILSRVIDLSRKMDNVESTVSEYTGLIQSNTI